MLTALNDYYHQLLDAGKIPRPGWCTVKVKYAIILSPSGGLLEIATLPDEGAGRIVPSRGNGTRSGKKPRAYFLCDDSRYLLGIDKAGLKVDYFERSKCLHQDVLDRAESSCAKAILRFFDTWDVHQAGDNSAVKNAGQGLLRKSPAAEITFALLDQDGVITFASEDIAIRDAWESFSAVEEEAPRGVCLVTGEKAPIARLHPSIKGVKGTRPSGAMLVSFNNRTFESLWTH